MSDPFLQSPVSSLQPPLRVLRLILKASPTSAPYNQFTLPLLDTHDITLCTFHRSYMPLDCRIDYVEGDGSLKGFVARLWSLLRTREFDLVHVHAPHLALLLLAVALVARPSVLLRSVLHVHNSYHVFRPRNRWMLLPAFIVFRRVLCCGHAARLSFPRLYRWLAGRRLVTVCNGADMSRVDRAWAPREAGIIERTGALQLVSVGRLLPVKNHETVIRALAQAKARDVRLTIVGDGPAREMLESLCRQLGVADRVRFTGQMARDQTLLCLWRADAFVSMSRGEGVPVAVLEAMGCHCPAVLSDIPPHREIRGTRTDLIPLFEPDDVDELAGAIDDWAGMPLDVLRSWGADCRQHVEWDYSLERMLAELEWVLADFNPTATPEWTAFCQSTHTNRRRVA